MGKLYLKDGVDINGLTLEMVWAIPIIMHCYAAFESDTTITSGLDGTHIPRSYHYDGDALDIRIWDVVDSFEVLAEQIRVELIEQLPFGSCFDVVCSYREDDEGKRVPSHLHIEFDRRRYNEKGVS